MRWLGHVSSCGCRTTSIVAAELADGSLLTLEIHGSNPNLDKNISYVNIIKKTKRKEKEPLSKNNN